MWAPRLWCCHPLDRGVECRVAERRSPAVLAADDLGIPQELERKTAPRPLGQEVVQCLLSHEEPELPARNLVWQTEFVASQHLDVLVQQRRKPGHVFRPDDGSLAFDAIQSGLDRARVPEHHDNGHQAQGSQLILHAFPVLLPEFPFPTVKEPSGHRVSSLSAVERHQEASPVTHVVDVGQQIQRYGNESRLSRHCCDDLHLSMFWMAWKGMFSFTA
jgi:hypothetical protein